MDHQITAEDLEFSKWLDSKVGEQYWDKDETSENMILRSGWEKTQKEYFRKQELKKNEKRFKALPTCI